MALCVFLAACGSSGRSMIDGAPGGGDGGPHMDGAPGGDGGPGSDAAGPGGCAAENPQCNNCIDDDSDGFIDGFDPECTGAIDNDEGSFSTGIPGDNIDPKNQDCFFDGNSGSGDDGCNMPTCCILGYTAQQCADAGLGNSFNPATDCPPPSMMCITNCASLTVPGCDCFGCCEICDGAGCANIYINPAVDPMCDQTTIHDPTKCLPCTPSTVCGTACGVGTCVLCPGQDPSTLPPTCTGAACPSGETTCTSNTDCTSTQFCSAGCCIANPG
jgi:hypothetical protein